MTHVMEHICFERDTEKPDFYKNDSCDNGKLQ